MVFRVIKKRPLYFFRASPSSKMRKLQTHMRRALSLLLCATLFSICIFVHSSSAQQKTKKNETVTPSQLLTRTTSRQEIHSFNYGGTITIIGAPAGSIIIEGWSKSEVDITADIELKAPTEEDLTLLAAVNTFTADEDLNHLRILTKGTHDKVYMRRTVKNFPKNLLGLPWKIDYRLRVPLNTDIEINAGRGPVKLYDVEGALSINATESDVELRVTGGQLRATIGRGSVNLIATARSWRGPGADITLAAGDINAELPAGFSADINANILRTGQIENNYAALTPRERTTQTPQSLRARAGAGGPTLSFTIGDGTLRIKSVTSDK